MSIAGPFDNRPFSQNHINRVGIIPKGTPGKWRLITVLYFPLGCSITDGISEEHKRSTCPCVQQHGAWSRLFNGKFRFEKSLQEYPHM